MILFIIKKMMEENEDENSANVVAKQEEDKLTIFLKQVITALIKPIR